MTLSIPYAGIMLIIPHAAIMLCIPHAAIMLSIPHAGNLAIDAHLVVWLLLIRSLNPGIIISSNLPS